MFADIFWFLLVLRRVCLFYCSVPALFQIPKNLLMWYWVLILLGPTKYKTCLAWRTFSLEDIFLYVSQLCRLFRLFLYEKKTHSSDIRSFLLFFRQANISLPLAPRNWINLVVHSLIVSLNLIFPGLVSMPSYFSQSSFGLDNFDFCCKNKSILKVAYLWVRQRALLIFVQNHFLVVATSASAMQSIFTKQV